MSSIASLCTQCIVFTHTYTHVQRIDTKQVDACSLPLTGSVRRVLPSWKRGSLRHRFKRASAHQCDLGQRSQCCVNITWETSVTDRLATTVPANQTPTQYIRHLPHAGMLRCRAPRPSEQSRADFSPPQGGQEWFQMVMQCMLKQYHRDFVQRVRSDRFGPCVTAAPHRRRTSDHVSQHKFEHEGIHFITQLSETPLEESTIDTSLS